MVEIDHVAAIVAGQTGAESLYATGGSDVSTTTPASDDQPSPTEPLHLLAEGIAAKVIARRLGIAEVTVRNHIRALLSELSCHSQLQAVAEARRRGEL